MLDAFLEVAYEADKQASVREELVEHMMKLPEQELHKIAQGELKLAYHLDGGSCWLDQFKGTPLYEQALALETHSLELDIADQQKRQAERAERDATWDQRDALCVQKRLLELELRKQEAGMVGGAPEELPPQEEPSDEEKQASAINELAAARGAAIIEKMRKEAEAEELPVSMRVGKELGKTWLGPAAAGLSGILPGAALAVAGADGSAYILGHAFKDRLGRAYGTTGRIVGGALGGLAGGAAGYTAGRGIARAAQGFGAGAVERKEKQLAGRKPAPESAARGEGSKAQAGTPKLVITHAGKPMTREEDHAFRLKALRSFGEKGSDKELMAAIRKNDRKAQAGTPKQASALDEIARRGEDEKKAEKTAAFQVADAWGREMAKEAIMLAGATNALTQGAKALGGNIAGAARGAGSFLGQAGKGIASAARSGNVGQVGQALKNTAGLGVRQATQWGAQNPMLAAGVGAAGLGGAYTLGRARG